ncbi:MAG: hypothetical protein SVR94_10510 [Pseudomonadota bacterium]|nr:hypothetical protein [Pseudomonadota bacterium]
MIDYGNAENMTIEGENIVHYIIADGERVRCIIPREVIEDKLRLSGTLEETFQSAKDNFDEITDILMHKISIGAREQDGSLMLYLHEWK